MSNIEWIALANLDFQEGSLCQCWCLHECGEATSRSTSPTVCSRPGNCTYWRSLSWAFHHLGWWLHFPFHGSCWCVETSNWIALGVLVRWLEPSPQHRKWVPVFEPPHQQTVPSVDPLSGILAVSIHCGNPEYAGTTNVGLEGVCDPASSTPFIASQTYPTFGLNMGHSVDLLSEDLAVSIRCDLNSIPLKESKAHRPAHNHFIEVDSDHEIGSGFEIPGDEMAGVIQHLPITPLNQQPEWMQILFNIWTQTVDYVDDSTTIHIRSWYLNPHRYITTEVWRPILLPPSPDGWFNCVQAVWHDLFEHDRPIDGFIVQPQPLRPISDQHFVADLILCQCLEEFPYHRPTLTVTQLIGDHFVRLHSRASLIPEAVSKWYLIYLNGNEGFCAGPSYPVDFHRLCQARRAHEQITAVPVPVTFGDSFTIDIFPPTQILEEELDDFVNLMGRNPVLVREDYNPPPQVDADRESTPSEALVIEPRRVRWYRTLVYTRDREGIVGRISEGSLNHLYSQVAHMLEISEHSLLTLHEVRHAPPDIDFYDYIWIAHRIDDVPSGSRSKLVIVDVEFCSNLPRLESETIRSVKLLTSPITRTTLLRLLGLAPYCNRWPCLAKINEDFIHETAPVVIQHGDWIQVILAPPGPCDPTPSRLVALGLHHGLQPHDIVHLQRQLPDGFDLEQMPNPDVVLNELEFDMPRTELMQRSATLFLNEKPPIEHIPAIQCRYDEFDEVRDQIAQQRNNAQNAEDNQLLDMLANLPPNLRDLHGLWMRGAARWLDGRMWAPVLTWYISYRHYRICITPQTVWLTEDAESWMEEIRRAWSPFYDEAEDDNLVLITPQPSGPDDGHIAHVLLVQHHEVDHEAAALVTLRDDGHPRQLIERQAMVLPTRITHELLLNVANRLAVCVSNRAIQCDTFYGTFPLNNEPMIGRVGLLYDVVIHRLGQQQLMPQQTSGILPDTVAATEPTFVHDLLHAIRLQSRIEPELPVNLKVTTWFLNHELFPQCTYGRDVLLAPTPQYWLAQILQTWTDIFDPHLAVDVFFVRPRPSHTKWQIDINFHLLLHQQPLPHLRSVLVSTFDESRGHPDPPGIHRAYALPSPVYTGSVARAIGCSDWHLAADRYIYVTCGPTPIGTARGFVSEHGHSFRVLLSNHELPQWQGNSGLVEPLEVVAPTPIQDLPQFERDVWAHITNSFEVSASTWEGTTLIATWYVDHNRYPIQQHRRDVWLSPQPQHWRRTILRVWNDIAIEGQAAYFFLAHPQPLSGNGPEPPHILVIQSPMPNMASTLLHIKVFDDGYTMNFVRAVTLTQIANHEMIYQVAQLGRHCTTFQLGTICTISSGNLEYAENHHIPVEDGRVLTIEVHNNVDVNSALFQDVKADTDQTSNDAHSLLQLTAGRQFPRAQPVKITLADYLEEHLPPEPTTMQADGEFLWDTLNQLDGILLPLRFDFPWTDHWPELCSWCEQWWDFQTPFSQLQIYYDGSFFPDEEAAGIGAAAFVLTDWGWNFAGALATRCPHKASSYEAELWAGVTASKLAIDLLRFGMVCGNSHVDLHLCFDALTVGHQADGTWSTFSKPDLGLLLRSLTLLISKRFDVDVSQWHVRGHRGEVGNEFVDELAKRGANLELHTALDDWFDWATSHNHLSSLPWVWILFDPYWQATWKGHSCHLPTPPQALPEVSVLPKADSTAPAVDADIRVTLQCATHNALTLAGSIVYDYGSPSRVEHLLRLMKNEGIHLFGIQETRLRTATSLRDPRFLIFKSQASAQGHFGMMIGLSLDRPYAISKGRPLYFTDSAVSIIASEPRRLILRIKAVGLKCIVANLHAPHTGQSEAEIAEWWNVCSTLIPPQFHSWPLILLTDANAMVGHDISDQIGPLDGADGGSKADPFIEFVHRHQIFLPSTFEAFHKGPSSTWTHSSGQQRRIDFIGLPLQWNLDSCSSWTLPHFGSALLHDDHVPVLAKFSMVLSEAIPATRRPRKLSMDNFQQLDFSQLHHIPQPSWEMDVHSHFDFLQTALGQLCSASSRKGPTKPRKVTLTEHTWALIQEKRHWRADLAQFEKQQKLTRLRLAFSAWQLQQEEPLMLPQFETLLAQQDKLISEALFNFRQLGRAVTKAIRRDDANFYEHLLGEGADFLAPHQVKDLWGIVRRSLPQHKLRRQKTPPLKNVNLEDKWVPYLCSLELGEAVDQQQLLERCCRRQSTLPVPTQWTWKDIPTLQDLEMTFRQVQPGRSTGFDSVPSDVYHRFAPQLAALFYPLMVKIFAWGQEPIQLKGGGIAMIHKKGSYDEVSNFRSIMLLPTFSKRVHALLRMRLASFISPLRPPGQMGGFQGQQTPFGSQAIRIYGSIGHVAKLSCGILFIDLSNAFHRLLRETVLGTAGSHDWMEILEALHAAGHSDIEHLKNTSVGILEEMGCPEPLLRLLRDVHQDTWLSLTGTELVRTRRGTRPGSPIADILFHALMLEVTRDIDTWLAQHPVMASVASELGIPMNCVVWSDDLAVPWYSLSADDLTEGIGKLLAHIHSLFTAKGFALNFGAGKTGAVLTFRGENAPKWRQSIQLVDKPGFSCTLSNGENVFLHCPHAYKHLGSLYSSAQTIDLEIRHRLGLAKGAFAAISRPLLTNRRLPCYLRVRLFNCLIISKLFYGLGAWPTPTTKQLKNLTTFYMTCITRVLRVPKDEIPSTSHADLLSRIGLPDVRTRLAVDRLLYAQKLYTDKDPCSCRSLSKQSSTNVTTRGYMASRPTSLGWRTAYRIPFLMEHLLISPPFLTCGKTDPTSGGAGSNRPFASTCSRKMSWEMCIISIRKSLEFWQGPMPPLNRTLSSLMRDPPPLRVIVGGFSPHLKALLHISGRLMDTMLLNIIWCQGLPALTAFATSGLVPDFTNTWPTFPELARPTFAMKPFDVVVIKLRDRWKRCPSMPLDFTDMKHCPPLDLYLNGPPFMTRR